MTLDAFEHDLLLEVASVAAGKSIKPITNMTGKIVSISSLQLVLDSMERISDTMGSPEQPKTVVFVRIDGDANGAVLLLVNPNDINTLLSNVDGKLRISALEEITNIISGASLGGLSRLLNMKFHQSITLNTTDMLRAVVNEIITDIGITNSEILCFAINLKVGVNPISISLYLLFDEKTSSLILTSGKNQMENKHADTN